MKQRSASALLQSWCERLAAGDVEGGLELLHEDVVVLAPLVPDPVPKRMEGREAFAAAFRPVGALFSAFRWTALEVFPGEDPEVAFGVGSAAITLADGRPYTQDYALLARARQDRIVEYREYLDPVRAHEALAGFAPAG
ncbi:MAG: nuclear transport factor 2 family protein [Solirubrobacterales bacterium]|nr:nuclear transport factor 2 family protein [Solirubrobacterales bacterium]